jgi:transglutaminase-like putative cysteine protease
MRPISNRTNRHRYASALHVFLDALRVAERIWHEFVPTRRGYKAYSSARRSFTYPRWPDLATAKSMCAILVAVILWHYSGIRLFAETLATQSHQATRAGGVAPLLKGIEHNGFDSLLAELRDVAEHGRRKTKSALAKGFASIGRLTELRQRLTEENEKVQEYFSRLEDYLTQKGLPKEIVDRQVTFARDYTAKYEALMACLESIETAHNDDTGLWARLTGNNERVDWDATIGKALTFLEENVPRARRRSLDPNNLPHRSLKADKPIPPKLTREEWFKAFPAKAPEKDGASAARAEDSAPLYATAPPTPADLAETIEVKFTPEIRQLADSLGKNPVKIFNWVRNNIEFVPTWGSIQGAQLCMETRAGNSFDSASLLIALLRYSGIPARYQMGTIDIPIEKAKNWLGGFSDPRAAARFVASGGVPSAGTVEQAGFLRSIRMEHVWVKAFVDYVPSRGEVNGQRDTWVDVDPSFKLYLQSPGVDLKGAVAFDAMAFNNRLAMTSTINESENFVTNIDQAFITSIFNNSVNNLSKAFPGADPNTLVPTRTVIMKQLPIFAANTPYRITSRGPALATLPSELRHSIAITVSDRTRGVVLTYRASLPELATKTVSLSYILATEADVSLVRSVITPALLDPTIPGNPQRIIDAIPSYLVVVRPVIQLDGLAAFSGSPAGMGETQRLTVHFDAPTIGTPDVTLDLVAWGRYGLSLDHAGVSATVLNARTARLQSIVQQYQSANGQGQRVAPIESSFHDLLRSGWFFAVDQASELFSKLFAVRFARYPSLAFSFTENTVSSIFGVPQRVTAVSYFLDVARQFQIVTALNGDMNTETAFNIAIGFQSSLLEGEILARLFSGHATQTGGISAVNALRTASREGIPIYGINSANMTSVLPKIDAGFPKEAIADAINAGRVVYVPQRAPLIDGASVNGYITLDPLSGDGAYLVGRAGAGEIKCCPNLPADELRDCQIKLQIADFYELFFAGIALLAGVVASISAIVAAAVALEVTVAFLAVLKLAGAITVHAAVDVGIVRYVECLSRNPASECTRLLLTTVLRAVGLASLMEFFPGDSSNFRPRECKVIKRE